MTDLAAIRRQEEREATRLCELGGATAERGHTAGPLGTLATPALYTRKARDSALGVELATALPIAAGEILCLLSGTLLVRATAPQIMAPSTP